MKIVVIMKMAILIRFEQNEQSLVTLLWKQQFNLKKQFEEATATINKLEEAFIISEQAGLVNSFEALHFKRYTSTRYIIFRTDS